jgi:hypothetical protein
VTMGRQKGMERRNGRNGMKGRNGRY